MDAKLKSAMEKLKSAITEVESCMSMGSEPEAEESEEMSGMEDSGLEETKEPVAEEKSGKKQMIMSLMKKKGY